MADNTAVQRGSSDEGPAGRDVAPGCAEDRRCGRRRHQPLSGFVRRRSAAPAAAREGDRARHGEASSAAPMRPAQIEPERSSPCQCLPRLTPVRCGKCRRCGRRRARAKPDARMWPGIAMSRRGTALASGTRLRRFTTPGSASGVTEMLSMPHPARNARELGVVARRLAADADLAALPRARASITIRDQLLHRRVALVEQVGQRARSRGRRRA